MCFRMYHEAVYADSFEIAVRDYQGHPLDMTGYGLALGIESEDGRAWVLSDQGHLHHRRDGRVLVTLPPDLPNGFYKMQLLVSRPDVGTLYAWVANVRLERNPAAADGYDDSPSEWVEAKSL